MFSMLIARPVLEIYDIGDVQICLSDYAGEGNSENDTSENSEEDTEIHSFKPLEILNVLNKISHHTNFDYSWVR